MEKLNINDFSNYESNIVNQLELAKKEDNLKYFDILNSDILVEDLRALRIFLNKAHLSEKTKKSFVMCLYYNGTLFRELDNIDASKINEDNILACITCISYKQYPDKLYNYDRTGDELCDYIEGLLIGIDLDQFIDNKNILPLLVELKDEYNFDIYKVKDKSKKVIETIIECLENDYYNDILLDPRINNLNVELFSYLLECDYKIDKLLDRDLSTLNLLKSYISEGGYIDDVVDWEYDDLLFTHLLHLRLGGNEIDENKLIKLETRYSDDIGKRKIIYAIIESNNFDDRLIYKILNNYGCFKDKISSLILISDYTSGIKENNLLAYLIDSNFSAEQLEAIAKSIESNNVNCINYISTDFAPRAIENIFRGYNHGFDFSNLTNEELNNEYKFVKRISYLKDKNVEYNINFPDDCLKKFIHYTNKDFIAMFDLIKNDVYKPEGFDKNSYKYKTAEYLIEYNKTHEEVPIIKNLRMTLEEVKEKYPIDTVDKDIINKNEDIDR